MTESRVVRVVERRKTGGMMERKEQIVPQEVMMAKQILSRLGDYSAMADEDDVISNIRDLAVLLASLEEISDLFVLCFTTLSVQASIIASLLAMVFKSNRVFPSLVIEKLTARFITALQKDEVQTAKLLLRSMAALASSNCILLSGENSFFSVIEALNDVTEGSWVRRKEGSSEKAVLDHQGQVTAYLVATALPWVLTSFNEPSILLSAEMDKAKIVLKKAVDSCERVCAEWSSPFEVGGQQAVFHVGIIHTTDSAAANANADDMKDTVALGLTPLQPPGSSCWDSLYEACAVAVEAVNSLNSTGSFTPPAVMCCPWLALKEDLEAVAVDTDCSLLPLGDLLSEQIRSLNSSRTIGSKGRYCLPDGLSMGCGSSQWLTPRFPIFDSETCPDCLPCCTLSNIEKYTIIGYYRDIIQFFDPILLPDGTRTGSMEVLLAHLLAVGKMLPETSDSTPIHMEYFLLETIFPLLLQVPVDPTYTSVLYRIILDVSKKLPAFAPAVAIGTGILYNLLQEMDSTSATALAGWLGYHLNNTRLIWPYWAHWAKDCEDVEGGGVKMFCASVIDHCTRPSVPDRIIALVPQAFHILIPADCVPCCSLFPPSGGEIDTDMTGTLAVEENTLGAVAASLKGMIERREEADAVEEWLEAIDPTLFIAELSFYSSEWRAQILLQALLCIGGSVISVITRLTDRYLEPLRTLSLPIEEEDSNEAQARADHVLKPNPHALIMTLTECVGHEPGFFNTVLDILLRRGIISVAAAAEWSTSPSVLENVQNSYWPHRHLEVIVDRTLDIIRAATANRQELGGEMSMDETATMASFQQSRTVHCKKRKYSSDDKVEDMEVEKEADNGTEHMDDDEGGRRTRRRGDDSENQLEVSHETQNMDDEEDDPVTIATEAVILALESSRTVYRTVISRLIVSLMRREQLEDDNKDAADADTNDEWSVVAQSLLLRTLRSFHGAEAGYSVHGIDKRVVLSAVDAVASAIDQAEREGVISNANNSKAVNTWRSFAFPILI